MPPLVRFMISHAAVGFLLAIVFVGLLLAIDISGLRTLMLSSDKGGLALFLLTFFCGLTFASVQMGIAVMMSGDDEARPPRGGKWLKTTTTAMANLLAPPRQHVYAPIPNTVNKRPR